MHSSLEGKTRKPGRPRKNSLQIPARQHLLEAAISRIAREGTTDVSAREICADSNVTYAMVNYNFGSWNGLIAEAASIVYVDYIETLWSLVNSADREPEARLRAYLNGQLAWAQRMPGWGAVFNYPFSARKAMEILQKKFGHITSAYFQLNLARLEQLTIDVRENRVTDFPYTTENFPKEELLSDRLGAARSTMVGWTSLGMCVWASRGLTLEAQLPEVKQLQQYFFDFAMEQTIANIRADQIGHKFEKQDNDETDSHQ